ncbi:MAG: tryptophan--tRNA ligase [Candidatus Pacearchaeota archaeon]
MKKVVISPYEAYGKITEKEYEKYITQFGIKKIDEKIINKIEYFTKDIHFMLKRKIFFAHRDLDWILEKYENGEKFFLYTGRAPSGPVHIGHLLPWVFTKWLQEKFNAEVWFQFPNEEKFLFKKNISWEDTQKWLYENMLDVIAIGFKQKKTHFLIDTKHANLLYEPACKIAKHITFSMVRATFGFNNEINIGSIFFTSMQAVPSILPSLLEKKNIPCLIPCGIDQDAHFRIARDILPKLGFYKPALIECKFLPALQGIKKMSSSEEVTAIYTTDNPETVRYKIMKHAFSGGQPTIEEHRKKGGNPDIDISYQWLYMFFEPNDKVIEKIYFDYKSGLLLSSEIKEILINKINKFLAKHQKEREKAKNKVEKYIYNPKD